VKIQPPPGMRDFYPEDMRLQNWLFDAWRSASLAFGFSEYEGPIFEFLELYELKSGAGIASELFAFEDRGGRRFALRPEMTPTLARMVAARAHALPRPIKWFSTPRMCRAEKPQRGRLREFFQWNVDILGLDDPLADAEVIAVAADFFRRCGLGPAEVVIGVSSRVIASKLLAGLGVAESDAPRAFELIDRSDRLPPEVFAQQWDAAFGKQVSAGAMLELLKGADLERCLALCREAGPSGAQAADVFEQLWQWLDTLGARPWCAFDPRVVRGLAYYTGVVFEAHARSAALRALLGGGRYDDLTGLLDGPRLPGVGFGMGDAPMIELLREVDRLPHTSETIEVFVIDADPKLFDHALQIAARLRQAGFTVDFSYKRQALGKQLKQAIARGARLAVIVGDELATRNELTVKHLATGEQRAVASADLHALRALLAN
jgi:histidyl-tRNA synthetase